VVYDIELVFLEHFDRGPRSGDEEIIFTGREPEQFESFFELRIVKLCLVVVFEACLGLAAARSTCDSEDAGAVNPQIRELVQVRDADVQGIPLFNLHHQFPGFRKKIGSANSPMRSVDAMFVEEALPGFGGSEVTGAIAQLDRTNHAKVRKQRR